MPREDIRDHKCLPLAVEGPNACLDVDGELTFLLLAPSAFPQSTDVRTGPDAFGTWQLDAPGVRRHIRATDLPPPSHHDNDPEEPDFKRMPKVVEAPRGKMPNVPKGFAVQMFARGLKQPRVIRIAPNGDIFVAESAGGRVVVFSADAVKDGTATPEVFAENLREAFRYRVPSAE